MFAFIGILWACYPLLTIQVYSGDAKIWIHGDQEDIGQDKPRWAEKPPVGYIQQIIIKVRHNVAFHQVIHFFPRLQFILTMKS